MTSFLYENNVFQLGGLSLLLSYFFVQVFLAITRDHQKDTAKERLDGLFSVMYVFVAGYCSTCTLIAGVTADCWTDVVLLHHHLIFAGAYVLLIVAHRAAGMYCVFQEKQTSFLGQCHV